jgi:hypothetical protein
VAQTVAKYPKDTPLQRGYIGEQWWDNFRISGGRRRCKGGWRTLLVYVDFARNSD